ncbi:MAG: hypothetical protein ACOZCL_03970 [Bacillota bacterium]
MKSENAFDIMPRNSTIGLIFLTLVFIGLSLLTMHQPLYGNIPINIILPIIILLKLDMVFFEKLKLSTLLLMRIWVVLIFLSIVNVKMALNVILIFLCINIFEATITDFRKGNIYNSITGTALILSVPLLQGEWNGVYYLFSCEGVIFWIAAYTLWNWTFVTNEFSNSIAKLHIGILLTPIIGLLILGNPAAWFILRGNSLTIGGITQIYKKGYWEKYFSDSKLSRFIVFTKQKSFQLVLMIINIVLIAVPVLYYFIQLK